MRPAFLALFIFLLLPAVVHGEDLSSHPVRSMDWWEQAAPLPPLAQRVAPAGPELVDYLRKDYALWGSSPEEVAAIKPFADPDTINLVREALASIAGALPDHLRSLLEQRLLGVFLARELGSSGYTESVYPAEGGEARAFVVLDGALLGGRGANEWASYREGSFFAPVEGGPALSLRIAPDGADGADGAENDRLQAVRYILLHELGHCLGVMTGAHPDWNAEPPPDLESRYPFVATSWTIQQGEDGARYASRFSGVFPWRGTLRIYSFEKAPLTMAQAPEVHAALERHTNYPSLYAAVNPFEDFAESFAVYQHAVREERPWLVRLTGLPGGGALEYAACFAAYFRDGRCPEKTRFMARWFEGR